MSLRNRSIKILLLSIVVTTIGIILFEAVFWLQAELNLTNYVEIVVILIEKEDVEIEVTIVTTKPNLNNVGSADRILENY